MRAPERWRPQRRRIMPTVPQAVLDGLAQRAAADASETGEAAGDELDRAPAARLAEALGRGLLGGPWESGFPRYAWLREGDRVLEYRLAGHGAGIYVGYYLPPSYWPEGLS